jgi:hypothetical protein
MKLWQVIVIYVLVMTMILIIMVTAAQRLFVSTVKEIEGSGGLKTITHDIWEGKPK